MSDKSVADTQTPKTEQESVKLLEEEVVEDLEPSADSAQQVVGGITPGWGTGTSPVEPIP